MKPMVFNYQDYVKLQEENKRLREENTNMQIRCRIAESNNDRDCKNCKYHKADGCSRWECEYEPVMSDLIKKSDAIKALYKYNFVSKNVIEREINAIPSADAVEVVRCKDCKHRHEDECPMQFEEEFNIDEGDGYYDTEYIIHDYTRDDGFCSWGERRTND